MRPSKIACVGLVPLVLLSAMAFAAEEELLDSGTGYTCFIEPSEVIDLGSPVTGIIEKMFVDRTSKVVAGDVVVKLESVVEETNLRLARAQAKFTGEISEQKLRQKYANQKFERASAMHARKAVTLDLLEESEADLKLTEKQLEKARHNHTIAQLEFERAKSLLEMRNIRSPVDGVVIDKLAAPGEFVKDEPLVRIAQLDPLKVEVILPVESFGEIAKGDVIPVNIPMTGDTHDANVDVVDEVIEAASGTYRVTLKIPNPDLSIPSGMRCDLDHPAFFSTSEIATR